MRKIMGYVSCLHCGLEVGYEGYLLASGPGLYKEYTVHSILHL